MMLHKLKAMRDRWLDQRVELLEADDSIIRASFDMLNECILELDALIQECEDWVCVPREPTEEQRLAGLNVAMDYDADPRLTAPIYQAMVAEAEQKE